MTEYRRYQGKSYMVLDAPVEDDSYEYRMLAKNKIAGFLPLCMQQTDGRRQLWYDISGMQSLEGWFEQKKIGGNFLKKLMAALSRAAEQAGNYLLCEEGISLAPERIFVNAEETKICFCYVPSEKKSFEDALSGLMEYYISHMQHGNGEGIRACYLFYEKCQMKNMDFEEAVAALFAGENGDSHREQEKPQAKEVWPVPEKEPPVLSGGKGRLSFGKTKESFLRLSEKIFAETGRGKQPAKERKPYVFEPEDEKQEILHPTVFLGSETEEIFGELRYEGDGRESNLKAEPPVFVIGSHASKADGVIADDSVSRIHARLMKEDDGWYLEDLNSTNGTFLNGEPLHYRKKARLKKNDKVTFAKESYRFV